MSAKKGNETKLPQDEAIDSGFLSGPCEFSGEIKTSEECDNKTVQSKSEVYCQELDSGVQDLSECLSSVQLIDTDTPTATPDIPPISILFEQDIDGDTQLHIASVHGCENSVSTLIRVCPDKDWLNVPNDFGHTPLHLAVMSGNEIVTRMLVLAGASILVRDREGETPIHKATTISHLNCLQALLAPVPEHPQRNLSRALNQKNYNGQSCVHLAAQGGHLETLQMLVYYGADINARESLAGWTALHVAARRGDARVVAWARARGADCGARDYAGRTARRLARRTPARHAFGEHSDTESDTDDDMYDSDSESLFERLSESLNPINVA